MKTQPLDDLEMFELLQACYPEKFPDDEDETFEAALMEAGARINALAANERRLIDELAKARKDARRYRWLRGGHGSAAAAQHEESADKGWERVNWLYDEDVDALIDAEMAAEPAVGAAYAELTGADRRPG